MPPCLDKEALVLRTVCSIGSLTMDQAVKILPELSWSEVFQAVDALSRRGVIVLYRKNFDYVLRAQRSTGSSSMSLPF